MKRTLIETADGQRHLVASTKGYRKHKIVRRNVSNPSDEQIKIKAGKVEAVPVESEQKAMIRRSDPVDILDGLTTALNDLKARLDKADL